MSATKRVLVVGGGISGLSLAYFLSQACRSTQIVLAEASPSVGGWMQTQSVGGYLFERGPRSILVRPPKTRILKNRTRTRHCARHGCSS